MNGRMTRGAADAILASLYLNAEVFTGTVGANGLTKGTQRWQSALDAANRVISATASGAPVYALETNWQKNFTADNYASKEIIMATKELAANSPQDLGLNFMMRTLHYNSLSSQTPWNGFATIAETYNAFDPVDVRRLIFLSGPQVNLETGAPAFARDGTPLNFTVGINDPTQAKENEGIRVMKWPLDPNKVGVDNGNDYGTFRLAEMYLIRAEAENELGGAGTAQAITDLNTIRARAFSPAKPTTAVTQAQVREAIYQERLFEFMAESKRRQDLIRAGPLSGGTVNRYLLPWSFKLLPTEAVGTVRPAYKILFPIPQTQIETNPLLKQNAGY
jgi:hypothetical protein